MKAITIWQPYPWLVGAGVKQWETRPNPPSGNMCPDGVRGYPGHPIHAGERIAIHAAARIAPGLKHDSVIGDRLINYDRNTRTWGIGDIDNGVWDAPIWSDLHLSAIVATAVVARAVPITDGTDFSDGVRIAAARCGLTLIDSGPEHFNVDSLDDQMPYGIWEPGRWAWELADIEVLRDPIPTKGKQGVWETAA